MSAVQTQERLVTTQKEHPEISFTEEDYYSVLMNCPFGNSQAHANAEKIQSMAEDFRAMRAACPLNIMASIN
ncbi:MAG: hypothetical protein ACOYIK_02970 [Coriobacteriales bacterium]|jgi:hypothetical protein